LPTEHVDRTEFQTKILELPEKSRVVSSSITITNSEFDANVNFGNNLFGGSNFIFENTTFRGDADFRAATFSEYVDFSRSTFSGMAYFNGGTFSGEAYFNGTTFSGYANFKWATFRRHAYFDGAAFSGEAYFSGATFGEDGSFSGSKFEGEVLTFRDTTFILAKSQEGACRRAKNVLEKNGNREEAGYHFYREMDAKRKQKPWYIRYPEYVFIQLIFGYGVHPFRLLFCWFFVAVIFALIYSVNGGIIGKLPASSLPQPWSYFVECFYFSVVTAVTPGYGKYELTSWVYQVIASAEAIFGTFMWAAFIATFARKYMR